MKLLDEIQGMTHKTGYGNQGLRLPAHALLWSGCHITRMVTDGVPARVGKKHSWPRGSHWTPLTEMCQGVPSQCVPAPLERVPPHPEPAVLCSPGHRNNPPTHSPIFPGFKLSLLSSPAMHSRHQTKACTGSPDSSVMEK